MWPCRMCSLVRAPRPGQRAGRHPGHVRKRSICLTNPGEDPSNPSGHVQYHPTRFLQRPRRRAVWVFTSELRLIPGALTPREAERPPTPGSFWDKDAPGISELKWLTRIMHASRLAFLPAGPAPASTNALGIDLPRRRLIGARSPVAQGRTERRIAGEAENIIDAVVLRPLHSLDATVMTVAAPHDACVRRMFSVALSRA
jgi:hypothetical protein